jgi:hypothetical protein
MKLLTEMFQMVPVVYIEGGKRIVLSDLMKCYCPPALSALPPIKEACEAFEIMKNNYLAHLNEVQSRCAAQQCHTRIPDVQHFMSPLLLFFF